MDWKAHLFFGVFLGAAASYLLFSHEPASVAAFAAVSGLCALLPDIDAAKSKVSQIVIFSALIAFAWLAGSVWSWKAGNAGFGLSGFAMLLAGILLLEVLRPRHRGITHTAFFMFGLSFACLLAFGEFAASAAFVGYASHLAADGCVKLW